MKTQFLIISIVTFFIACTPIRKEKSFSNKDVKLNSNTLTPEVLWKFGRLSYISVSPDMNQVLYAVSYTNIEENKNYKDLYVYSIKDQTTQQITNTKINESSATWRPDGKKIGYLSNESGELQLWEINIDGSSPKQITNIPEGISGFCYSPDLSKILYTANVKLDSTINDIHPDLPLANARIENDIMYRHWDTWHDGSYSHIFITNYSNTITGDGAIDIMKGERYDSPLQPFGDISEICWTADSKSVLYTCKKLSGKAYALSTNSDIYQYNLENNTTTNLTKGMMGYDRNPVLSPNGKKLAFESMKRDGYESDKNRLMILDFESKEIKDYTNNFDGSISSITWSNSGDSIWFLCNHEGTDEIFDLSIKNKKITKVTNGIHDYTTLSAADNKLVASKMSMKYPRELYLVNPATGADENISQINERLLNQLTMGHVEERWITTTDNKKMKTWVIYPPNFDPNKTYPTLLYCQGGPQSTVSQFWSYRWNFQLMAANDYIIVAPNRRGLPGFGQDWNEQISGDYGGQNMLDYFSAIDSLAKEPFVDETKLGAIGASYGGYSVYWLAGNHQKRFKAFVSHCGIFNFDQMYATTEEMFFVNWDLKGAFWDKDNKQAQQSYAASPHLFVQHWDAPILVIHGEKDFRIPYTQGMAAFNAATLRNVPARFLYFPDENHWILSAQNGIVWHREFFKWLDQWLK